MIKYGRRIPRGQNRVPRLGLLRKVGYKPVLRATAQTRTASSGQQAMQNAYTHEPKYRVAIAYTLPDGAEKVFQGSFLARNAAVAEQQARAFVLRYIRPQHIDEVIAAPVS